MLNAQRTTRDARVPRYARASGASGNGPDGQTAHAIGPPALWLLTKPKPAVVTDRVTARAPARRITRLPVSQWRPHVPSPRRSKWRMANTSTAWQWSGPATAAAARPGIANTAAIT
ncbi:hypothetical protein BVI2075_320181 [Burkholderia vietnamiensis]|nr:hypothetical protein BVI2075_320181 [Burkholderia vietnamiensis]